MLIVERGRGMGPRELAPKKRHSPSTIVMRCVRPLSSALTDAARIFEAGKTRFLLKDRSSLLERANRSGDGRPDGRSGQSCAEARFRSPSTAAISRLDDHFRCRLLANVG